MTGSASGRSLPAPRPKSPPDLYGLRKEMARLQMLERENCQLEEELKFVEGLQPVSRCCKETFDFVAENPDPLIRTNQSNRKSCKLWKWLCRSSCLGLSRISCCTGCSALGSCGNAKNYCSCSSCSLPEFSCWCNPCPCCCGKAEACCGGCCSIKALPCFHSCSCKCRCSFPKCPSGPDLCACFSCKRNCCCCMCC